MFVTTKAHDYLNLRFIRRIDEQYEGDDCVVFAETNDGKRVRLQSRSVFEVLDAPLAIIPAQPGFEFLIGPVKDEEVDPPCIERHPIIAWKVDHLGYVTPIQPSGDVSNFCVVRYPSGMILDLANDCVHKDEDAWTEDLRRRAKSRAAAKITS